MQQRPLATKVSLIMLIQNRQRANRRPEDSIPLLLNRRAAEQHFE